MISSGEPSRDTQTRRVLAAGWKTNPERKQAKKRSPISQMGRSSHGGNEPCAALFPSPEPDRQSPPSFVSGLLPVIVAVVCGMAGVDCVERT